MPYVHPHTTTVAHTAPRGSIAPPIQPTSSVATSTTATFGGINQEQDEFGDPLFSDETAKIQAVVNDTTWQYAPHLFS